MALMDYIQEVEKSYGREAQKHMMEMQAGTHETYADITETTRDLDYKPSTPIEVGIPKFIEWFKNYYAISK